MSEPTQEEKEQKSQQLQQQYNRFQENIAELETQVSNLASQIQEHIIVDNTLSSIDPDKRQGRKCFKMIGGVLIDKSVDEVIKILNEELKTLTADKEKVEKELQKNRSGLQDWLKNNHVKIIKGNQ
ncbi:Gim4 protein [Scheffersomyces amazonensis]|uniref:Gim4 protein n=1 Tax=Scheffersomyces amazonensis TaxID=1078765 RepID=UPI00315DF0D8